MYWRPNDQVAYEVLVELRNECGALLAHRSTDPTAGITAIRALDATIRDLNPRDRDAIDKAMTRLTTLRTRLQGA